MVIDVLYLLGYVASFLFGLSLIKEKEFVLVVLYVMADMIVSVIWPLIAVASLFALVILKPEPESPELCPHGYEWDDCPDCCH